MDKYYLRYMLRGYLSMYYSQPNRFSLSDWTVNYQDDYYSNYGIRFIIKSKLQCKVL